MRMMMRRLRGGFLACAVVIAATMMVSGAEASFRQGQAAFQRQDYGTAARFLIPQAQAGQPQAQAYLGYMFENGRGVPQNYTEAAYWYRRAAEQGNSAAQYTLGLLYDKGYGVRQDPVEASKWLNLSAASASPASRDYTSRLRDAVSAKLTRGQIAESRRRALEWFPQPEQ